jgi:uncharacterized protein YlxW (UPF0749 family)
MGYEDVKQLIGNQEISSEGTRRGPGRPMNTTKAEMLNISISANLREQLEDITSTGLFGKSVAETANMLLWHAMGECVKERIAQNNTIKDLRRERAKREESKKKRDEAQKKRDEAEQLQAKINKLHAEADDLEDASDLD